MTSSSRWKSMASIFLFWNWVESTFVPWVATGDAAQGQPSAVPGAKTAHRLMGIAGTGGMKTAVAAQVRADEISIGAD